MYTNLLTQIRNAQGAGQERIKCHYSKMDEKVLSILAENSFIAEFEKKGKGAKKFFEIVLSQKNNKGVISGVRFVSTPSKRVYKKYQELRPVKQGYGMSVISTSKGIMTGREARTQKVGGQILFNIW